MALGYEFVTLDDDQKSQRRSLLLLYALVAQFSLFVIPALRFIGFFISKVARYGLKNERPGSPSFNKQSDGKFAWFFRARQRQVKLSWWMKKDVIQGCGTRGEWISAAAWTTWLLCLCVVHTGNDYLHLTKRFGAIGVSQLPFQYLLARRSPTSPVQWATRLSHENLKTSHQILGRIVVFFFTLHGAFYLNFFVQSGLLAKRIKNKDVILGLVSFIMFVVISTTALGQIRRWNYRAFYRIHICIAIAIVVPLYLHVSHIRMYVWEIVFVHVVNWLLRVWCTQTYTGTLKLLPGTDLVQIRIPLDSENPAFSWQPGQHVYLSQLSRTPYSEDTMNKIVALYNFSNPFTIASVSGTDEELLLVARTLNGNTKKLAELAHSPADESHSIPLVLEGPYGSSKYFPDFSHFDKILLVAGGVGASFVMPVYRSIVDLHDPDHAGHPQIRFVWAVRKLADTQWAFPIPELEGISESYSEEHSELHESSSVEVFVTRSSAVTTHTDDADEDIELEEREQLLSTEDDMNKPRKGVLMRTGRPNMATIVNEACSKGRRVAVIACGPKEMTRKLSASVEQWVEQGHDVYYHEETFGW